VDVRVDAKSRIGGVVHGKLIEGSNDEQLARNIYEQRVRTGSSVEAH
jgi:uncharacterized protein YuzB (UPF0349 family)